VKARGWSALAALAAVAVLPGAAGAGLELLPGFSAQVYVTGDGFAPGTSGGAGIPSVSTLAVDAAGTLYLARTGRRYSSGEQEDLFPVYRIPPGGARLSRSSEGRFLHGPPLPNPQVGGVAGGREVLLTTFDRERAVGVLYRLDGGRVEFVAGGAPEGGASPLLQQPEGVAAAPDGTIYVADRRANRVIALGRDGRLLEDRVLAVNRPRLLAQAADGALWVAADGEAEAPWQRGPGEIWLLARGDASRVLRGPLAVSMALSPAGQLFVADRQGAEVFVLRPDGRRLRFARFSDGDAPRALAFAPVTEGTRRAGIAGDLFVVVITRGAWPVNEVLRISGPFDRLDGEAR
jgi:hypothetical protein